jgi:hypothetical protein
MKDSFFPERWPTQCLRNGLVVLVAVLVLATQAAAAPKKGKPDPPLVHPVPGNLPISDALDIEYGELVRSFQRLAADTNNLDSSWNWNHPERLDEVNRNYRKTVMSQAYDKNAMVHLADGDPLGTVLRRAKALLGYYRTRKSLPAGRLDAFAGKLAAVEADAKKVPPVKMTKDFIDYHRGVYSLEKQYRHMRIEQFRDKKRLERFGEAWAKVKKQRPVDPRRGLFDRACAVRREIVMANPLLQFNAIVCMLEQPGEGRIMEQGRACWGKRPLGGGPAILTNFKTNDAKALKIQDVLTGVKVANGRWKGKPLRGAFSGLELSYDGKFLLFAATVDRMAWDVFRFTLATKKLEQLTDSSADDFDPHELPDARIMFTSTRRGGVGRCNLPPQSATYTLHSMDPDGSDIVALSYHETNEWSPTLSHEGMIIYTRWDYLDRSWGSAHHMWRCFPDGRNPRNLHGNYPLPHSGFQEKNTPFEDYHNKRYKITSGRYLRPDAEIGFRPIPNSHKYVAAAIGHHEGFSGSLIIVDPSIPDDSVMSQVRRLTPEVQFPESEQRSRYGHAEHFYGTPWPLSEDFYLCNHLYGVCVLDRFGNREVIYNTDGGPFRVRDAMPIQPRKRPPIIPTATWQGKRRGLADHKRATIKVVNCYKTDTPLPKNTKVKWMRIVQVLPHLNTKSSGRTYRGLSRFDDSVGRMPLGAVPVEDDGSVYCEAPVACALYFQLLDENGMAVHSMRSATYVHPGEQMTCIGCHEARQDASPVRSRPKAFARPPSKIKPEVSSGIIPFNFIKLVKTPVLDKKCLPCHQKHNAKHPPKMVADKRTKRTTDINAAKRIPDMTYWSLANPKWVFGYPGEKNNCLQRIGTGGSRTTPGRLGAHASGLMHLLKNAPQHKELKKTLTGDDWRRITIWLDMNSNNICWTDNDSDAIKKQIAGQALAPPIDYDPKNPLRTENDRP